MYCPIGYEQLGAAQDHISKLAKAYLPPWEEWSVSPMVEYRRITNLGWNHFFSTCSSLSVCPPIGAPRRIDPRIGQRLAFPYRIGSVSFPKWLFINPATWTVSIRKIEKYAQAVEKILNFYDHDGIILSSLESNTETELLKPRLTEIELTDLRAVVDAMSFSAALKQFEGWSVCFETKDRQLSLPNPSVLESPSQRGRVQQSKSSAKLLGRPQKIPSTRVAYLELFPEGHGKLPYKRLAEALRGRLGYSVSLDTIKRAIKQIEDESRAKVKDTVSKTL